MFEQFQMNNNEILVVKTSKNTTIRSENATVSILDFVKSCKATIEINFIQFENAFLSRTILRSFSFSRK